MFTVSPVMRKRRVCCSSLAARALITATRLYCCSDETTTGPLRTGVTGFVVRKLFFTSPKTASVELPSPHCQENIEGQTVRSGNTARFMTNGIKSFLFLWHFLLHLILLERVNEETFLVKCRWKLERCLQYVWHKLANLSLILRLLWGFRKSRKKWTPPPFPGSCVFPVAYSTGGSPLRRSCSSPWTRLWCPQVWRHKLQTLDLWTWNKPDCSGYLDVLKTDLRRPDLNRYV